MCAYVTVEFSVLYFHVLRLEWVNDETYLNVELGRLLEEGAFECRNIGKRCLTELNIVNNHHSRNKLPFNAYLRTSEQVSCVKEAAKINEGRIPSFRACSCQT